MNKHKLNIALIHLAHIFEELTEQESSLTFIDDAAEVILICGNAERHISTKDKTETEIIRELIQCL